MALLFNRLVATPLSHLYSGTGLFILGMFEPASVELEKAAEQLGNQASGSMVQYYLGLAYQERGQTASARQALETFISHSPLDPKDIRIEAAKRTLDQLKQPKGVS